MGRSGHGRVPLADAPCGWRRGPAASTSEWIKLVTIPFFTGAVGWLINWSGLIMLFNPVRFHGFEIPGLYELSKVDALPARGSDGLRRRGLLIFG